LQTEALSIVLGYNFILQKLKKRSSGYDRSHKNDLIHDVILFLLHI